MMKSEPQPSSKAPSAGRGLKRRPRLHKWAAALTHTLFALTLALTLVRNDTPRAAATGSDGTAGLRTQAAAKPPPGPEERLAMRDGDPLAIPARPDSGGAAPAADARHLAAAVPRSPTEASSEQVETTASPGEGELALVQKNRRKRDERPEPAPLPRAATEEEKTRFKPLLDRLVAAYPEFLASHDGTELTWKDGTRMPFDDGRQKTFEERLVDADLDDQMLLTYTPGPMLDDPLVDFDPGRIRNEAFFRKMYGDCKTGEVQKQLVAVDWLPKHGGKPVKVTPVNGVAEKLRRVSEELDALAPEMMKYLQPISGIFNCRNVSRTDRSSAHGFGIAVDINAKFGDYWQWRQAKRSDNLPYRNQIPWEIAAIFEKHGFIWGGKWYHFDTLHFEYRPELMVTADASSPQTSEAVPMPEKQPRNLN